MTDDHPPLEGDLAEIWSEVLGVRPIGPMDEFFQLGGDSMLAAELAALVRVRLGLPASLRLVFERPQLRDFAAGLLAGDESGAPEVAP